MGWPFEDLVTVPARWQYLTGLEHISLEGSECSETEPRHGIVSPIAMIHGPRNQGVDMGVAPLNIISSDLLVKFLLPVLVNL